jgi:outer membrane murein-binding lipoprotein Lpp
MNSELGMLLPFAFVIVAVWCGTRIYIARLQSRDAARPDIHARLDHLAARLDQLDQVVEATAAEVHRVGEAEEFTAQLLGGHTAVRPKDASTSQAAV